MYTSKHSQLLAFPRRRGERKNRRTTLQNAGGKHTRLCVGHAAFWCSLPHYTPTTASSQPQPHRQNKNKKHTHEQRRLASGAFLQLRGGGGEETRFGASLSGAPVEWGVQHRADHGELGSDRAILPFFVVSRMSSGRRERKRDRPVPRQQPHDPLTRLAREASRELRGPYPPSEHGQQPLAVLLFFLGGGGVLGGGWLEEEGGEELRRLGDLVWLGEGG